MQLVYKENNESVQLMDVVKCINGETFTVLRMNKPDSNDQVGRIHGKFIDRRHPANIWPSAMNAKWIK